MARRRVYEELLALFDYNPPPIAFVDYTEAFTYPNIFYDRHLDPRLTLKHVKLVPSLPHEIAQFAFDELKVLKGRGQLLPLINNKSKDGCSFTTRSSRATFPPVTDATDAISVAHLYQQVSVFNCSSIASTIALHPQAETWGSILQFDEGSEPESGRRPAMTDTFVVQIPYDSLTGKLDIFDSILSHLDDKLRANIHEMSRRFQTLVTMQFHAPLAVVEELFKRMGERAKSKQIPPLKCSVVGFHVQDNRPAPPDSISTLGSLPSITAHKSENPELRRSARLRSPNVPLTRPTSRISSKRKSKAMFTWPTVTVDPQKCAAKDPDTFIRRVCLL